MSAPVPPANPVFVDDGGAIAQNLECIGCSYNLRGLVADAHCPECGELVSESFAGRGFLRADARWLRQMEGGLRALTIAMVVSIFLFVVAWPGVLISCLVFTTPTEQVLKHETCNRKRIWARLVLAGSTGLLALSIPILVMDVDHIPPVWLMWLAAIFCTWIAMYRYAAEIARRFAEPGLMKSSRRMTVASAVVLGMVPVGSAGLWVLSMVNSNFDGLAVLLVLMIMGGALGAFVIMILTLALIDRFRTQMKAAAAHLDWQPPAPVAAVSPIAPVAPVEVTDDAPAGG